MCDTSDHPNSSRQEWSERRGGTEGGNKKKARREREKTNQAVSLVPVVDREEEREDTRLRVFALLTRWWRSSLCYIECSLTEDIHRCDRIKLGQTVDQMPAGYRHDLIKRASVSSRWLHNVDYVYRKIGWSNLFDSELQYAETSHSLIHYFRKTAWNHIYSSVHSLCNKTACQEHRWSLTRSFAQFTNWFIRLSDSKWIVFGFFLYRGHSLHEICLFNKHTQEEQSWWITPLD